VKRTTEGSERAIETWKPDSKDRPGKITIIGSLPSRNQTPGRERVVIIRTKKDDVTQLDVPRVYENVRRELSDLLWKVSTEMAGGEW
jgi:hypothetical protein